MVFFTIFQEGNEGTQAMFPVSRFPPLCALMVKTLLAERCDIAASAGASQKQLLMGEVARPHLFGNRKCGVVFLNKVHPQLT